MKNEQDKKYVKTGITAFVVLVLSMLVSFAIYRMDALGLFFGKILKILNPFLYAAVIAYLLTPMCGNLERFFEQKLRWQKGGKALAIVISVLVGLAIVVAILTLIIPQLVDSIQRIIAALPDQISNVSVWLDEKIQHYPDIQKQWDTYFEKIRAEIKNWNQTRLLPLAQSILGNLASYLTGMVGLIMDCIIGIVISVYILANRKLFACQARMVLRGMIPGKWADLVEEEVHYADRMFNGYLMGRLVDAVIVGSLCFVGCLVMGFSSPLLIAVIVGVTNIIPFFGPFIGAIPSAILLFLNNPGHGLMFIIFDIVLMQVDGNIIGPRVMGNATGLSGFWITFAILLFGGLWGLTGMLIGVPLLGVIYDIVRKLVFWGLRRNGQEAMVTGYLREFHPPVEGKKQQSTESSGSGNEDTKV